MSDLISRSALIERLEHDIKLTERYIRQDEQRNFSSDYISLNAQLNTRLSIKKTVEDMPTAYNVEKVVNTLRDRKAYFESCFEKSDSAYDIGKFMAYGDAAEIVRRGGIE